MASSSPSPSLDAEIERLVLDDEDDGIVVARRHRGRHHHAASSSSTSSVGASSSGGASGGGTAASSPSVVGSTGGDLGYASSNGAQDFSPVVGSGPRKAVLPPSAPCSPTLPSAMPVRKMGAIFDGGFCNPQRAASVARDDEDSACGVVRDAAPDAGVNAVAGMLSVDSNFRANLTALAQIKQLQEEREKEQQLQQRHLDNSGRVTMGEGDANGCNGSGGGYSLISSDFVNAGLAAAAESSRRMQQQQHFQASGGYDFYRQQPPPLSQISTYSGQQQQQGPSHHPGLLRSVSVPADAVLMARASPSNHVYPAYNGGYSRQNSYGQPQHHQQQYLQRHQMAQLEYQQQQLSEWGRWLDQACSGGGNASRRMSPSPYAIMGSSSPVPCGPEFAPAVAPGAIALAGQPGKNQMQIRCKFGLLGADPGAFNAPHGFCLGIRQEIVVADTNNHRIQIFNTNGSYLFSFGQAGKEDGSLWFPRKVAVSKITGNFVVCDRGGERSRMQVFDGHGRFLRRITIRFIDIVAGLAVNAQGMIVVVDSVTPTIFFIREADGELQQYFECSKFMTEPSDIAISNDEYYICDFKGHSVVVMNEHGDYLRRIGCESVTPFPNGIDVSDAGDVLIGDSHGNQFHVAVYSDGGGKGSKLLAQFTCPNVKVSRCCGLKITAEGFVVTLAKNNHHVLVLNTLYID